MLYWLLVTILVMLMAVTLPNFLANPIANMYGPYFLLFYAAIAIVTCWICHSITSNDSTAKLPPPRIPSQPNSLEIAYLRGGEEEVARLVVFDLIQQGLLEIDGKNIQQTPLQAAENYTKITGLSPIYEDVYNHFSVHRTAANLFGYSGSLISIIKPHCQLYLDHLQAEKMLFPTTRLPLIKRTQFLASSILFGLAGYKILVALINGRFNIWFLVIMAFISLALANAFCIPSRLSQRGEKYLATLQKTFEGIKSQTVTAHANPDPNVSPNVLLTMALFGVGVLTGSQFAEFEQLFRVQPASPSGGDSSSSDGGGGCSGGGGCGGGCGGCGGCGG